MTRVLKESNVASRAINRVTLVRGLSLSSWKAIWQITRWPRSPQAQAGDATPTKATDNVKFARWRSSCEWVRARTSSGERSRRPRWRNLVPTTAGGQSGGALTAGRRSRGDFPGLSRFPLC